MGVDTRIWLPMDVRVRDVSHVMGALAGLRVEKMNMSGGSYVVQCKDVQVKSTSEPAMCQINLIGKTVDGEELHNIYYHFESEHGGRSLSPRSTAFWICIGRGLVDFFGGQVDYADCDSVECDYRQPFKPRPVNNPSNGSEWQEFQDEILALKPITKKQLEEAQQWASYTTERK